MRRSPMWPPRYSRGIAPSRCCWTGGGGRSARGWIGCRSGWPGCWIDGWIGGGGRTPDGAVAIGSDWRDRRRGRWPSVLCQRWPVLRQRRQGLACRNARHRVTE
jgi:hypothetical protein